MTMLRTIDLGECGAYKGGGQQLGRGGRYWGSQAYILVERLAERNQLRRKERKEVRVSDGRGGKKTPGV